MNKLLLLLLLFHPGNRAGVFIWRIFIPPTYDLASHRRDLGKWASSLTHMNVMLIFIVKLFGGPMIGRRDVSPTGLIWTGPNIFITVYNPSFLKKNPNRTVRFKGKKGVFKIREYFLKRITSVVGGYRGKKSFYWKISCLDPLTWVRSHEILCSGPRRRSRRRTDVRCKWRDNFKNWFKWRGSRRRRKLINIFGIMLKMKSCDKRIRSDWLSWVIKLQIWDWFL